MTRTPDTPDADASLTEAHNRACALTASPADPYVVPSAPTRTSLNSVPTSPPSDPDAMTMSKRDDRAFRRSRMSPASSEAAVRPASKPAAPPADLATAATSEEEGMVASMMSTICSAISDSFPFPINPTGRNSPSPTCASSRRPAT